MILADSFKITSRLPVPHWLSSVHLNLTEIRTCVLHIASFSVVCYRFLMFLVLRRCNNVLLDNVTMSCWITRYSHAIQSIYYYYQKKIQNIYHLGLILGQLMFWAGLGLSLGWTSMIRLVPSVTYNKVYTNKNYRSSSPSIKLSSFIYYWSRFKKLFKQNVVGSEIA